MRVIVDRIEGSQVVVEIEKGKMSTLPIELIPTVEEGDIIDITINKTESAKRKKKIEKLIEEVFDD